MKQAIIARLLIGAFIWIGLACQSSDSSLTTIILVRHAEKIKDDTSNPPLNETGKDRSDKLADLLKRANPDHIYSTKFQRNMATVRKVAESHNLPVKQYDAEKDLNVFLNEVLSKHKGKTVVICGHKTTVPDMLNILTGSEKYQALKDNQDIFVATVKEMGNSKILNLNQDISGN